MKTKKLYETDGMCATFTARILEVQETENGYALLLDRTAFFPEGGGQTADTGRIGDARVLDVREKDGEILHLTDRLPTPAEEYSCQLDFEARFRKMQNHLGEHLLCGAMHRLYGLENVGFHLGEDYMTFDVDRPLTPEEILAAEALANRAIAENAPVLCYYPDEPSSIDYRAKSERLNATERIRIVEVEGYDRCACCAPHLDSAGKVGMIKIVDAIHYKGGMRFWAHCGFDALYDYDQRLGELRRAAVLLSVKPHEVASAVEARLTELGEAKRTIGALKRERLSYKLAAIPSSDRPILFFDDSLDAGELRNLANEGVKKTTALFAAFSGSDASGYQFVIASQDLKLKALLPALQDALGGKSGGSDKMLFGQVTATEEMIRRFLAKEREHL